MAPVSAVKSNSLFKYIKREKKKDSFIVISSDEESDDEIPVKTIPTTLPASSGHLNDPISIDLDSDTESMEKYALSKLQNQVANTHIIDSIAVPTPESVLSESTSLSHSFTAENGVNDEQYQQDDLVSFGSPMNEDLFHDFETEPAQATNLEAPPFITMQAPPVTQVYLDTESSLKSLNNSIKSQAPFYGLSGIAVPDLSTPCVEPRVGHKRVLELAESSTRLEQTSSVDKQDTDMEEDDDDEININALRSQAPKNVHTKKFDKMSLSEVLGSIEIYLQSVTEIQGVAVNGDGENMAKTRHTRRTPRYVRTGTPPYNESSQGVQATQGSFCDFPLQRPYMPAEAWYNCTWEDWAQFKPGDILHVPFNDEEKEIVVQQLGKHQTKKLKMSRSSLDIWQIVEGALPGRTAQDCKYYSCDLEENKFLHNKPVMIRKPKKHLISRNQYAMLRQRRSTGIMSRSSVKLCQWMNLSKENTIGGGSGDALSLAIYRNPRTKNMCVAVGSLCDENVQYNLPGNLRTWDSITDTTTPLAGHKSAISQTQNEEIWRTVTDVKLSRDRSCIISASHDGSAKVWRTKCGKLISTLCYHEKPINQLAINNSVRENVIATCSNDGSATVWSLTRNGREGRGKLCELGTEDYNNPIVECIQFGRDHTRNQLFMGVCNNNIDNPGYVTSFDAETGDLLMRYQSINGSVCTIDISSTGQYIASGNYSNLDGFTGDGITHIHDYRQRNTAINIQSRHKDVNVVSFSPCERFIASGNADKENAEVVIFDIRNPARALHTLSHRCANSTFLSPDSSVGIGGIYWMSNGKQFISGGGDSKVKLWNLAGATELLKSYETTNCVTSLAVDEDCMTLAAGVAGAQGVVHVWQP